MSADLLKAQVAKAALEYIEHHLTANAIIGVGTGSTADLFIDELISVKDRFRGAVASSARSAKRLQAGGIEVIPMDQLDGQIPVYVDGADEINPLLQMVKGGGGALTQEKIVASAAKEFVCIVDESKWVKQLGNFKIPVEVIESARTVVSRALLKLGAKAVHERTGFITDNGHPILDIEGLLLDDAQAMEQAINQIPGIVTCGLFANEPASAVLLGKSSGVDVIQR